MHPDLSRLVGPFSLLRQNFRIIQAARQSWKKLGAPHGRGSFLLGHSAQRRAFTSGSLQWLDACQHIGQSILCDRGVVIELEPGPEPVIQPEVAR